MIPITLWALKCQGNKTYSQDLEDNIKITMAALGHDAPANKSATLYVEFDGVEVAVCTLTGGKVNQQPLDLVFSEGDKVTFIVKGDLTVFLTGSYLVDLEDHDHEDLEEYMAEMYGDEEIDDEIDEEIESDLEQDRIQEIEQESESEPELVPEPPKKEQKRKQQQAKQEQPTKKPKQEAQEKPKQQEQPSKKEAQEQKQVNEKTMGNGLVIKDVKVGNGPKAKPGRKISVRYIGKLKSGKTFDSNTSGAPFSFKLGAGSVIKGWDLGIEGMCVGGTRQLTIPAKLAYGQKGASPDIPPNATLVFDIKLLDVK